MPQCDRGPTCGAGQAWPTAQRLAPRGRGDPLSGGQACPGLAPWRCGTSGANACHCGSSPCR
eukprot:14676197-Heterocapsa_arctica.AAC.1